MAVIAVVGANWGDEGKGKLTDCMAQRADVVVRFQGGNNAGHTIMNCYGKFVLHLLPAGVFNRNAVNILGPGVALNIPGFFEERTALIKRGVPEPKLRISDRIQIVMPFHVLFDELEEERLADRRFGSTKSGIAPFYADKFLKLGIQACDLLDKNRLINRLESSLVGKNVLLQKLYKKPIIEIDSLVPLLRKQGEAIKPYLIDSTAYLRAAMEKNKRILLEGQLGALRDPDHGIYPYPTSSSPLAGYAAVGAGIPPYKIKKIVAVTKAYSSCIGAGPFITELDKDQGDVLRAKGGADGEYGAKTGRPRRMGWFDAVATAYGCMVQGATGVALTNLDVLGYLPEIPVCTQYIVKGKRTTVFPVPARLDDARPVYKMVPGWKCDISSVRRYNDLPSKTKKYVKIVERAIACPVQWISVGPRREETIKM